MMHSERQKAVHKLTAIECLQIGQTLLQQKHLETEQ